MYFIRFFVPVVLLTLLQGQVCFSVTGSSLSEVKSGNDISISKPAVRSVLGIEKSGEEILVKRQETNPSKFFSHSSQKRHFRSNNQVLISLFTNKHFRCSCVSLPVTFHQLQV